MDKLMCFVNYIEMARVTGVPFNYLLSRGQSIKVLSKLYRKANEDDYIIPVLKGEGTSLDFLVHQDSINLCRFGRTVRRRYGY